MTTQSRPESRDVESCRHPSVTAYEFADGEPGDLWACAVCMRRFYPACSTCVDVGHRNVKHPEPTNA